MVSFFFVVVSLRIDDGDVLIGVGCYRPLLFHTGKCKICNFNIYVPKEIGEMLKWSFQQERKHREQSLNQNQESNFKRNDDINICIIILFVFIRNRIEILLEFESSYQAYQQNVNRFRLTRHLRRILWFWLGESPSSALTRCFATSDDISRIFTNSCSFCVKI